MILIDTSVWVDHFRRPEPTLAALIADGDIALHPFTFGELLLGGLPGGGEVAKLLLSLSQAPVASAQETAAFIAWAKLSRTGVGYVDTHLLMSARLIPLGRLMTRDKRLHAQAERLGIAFAP
ncbi:MAG: PIN domain-containing protein [Sphingomicrobium sp.]